MGLLKKFRAAQTGCLGLIAEGQLIWSHVMGPSCWESGPFPSPGLCFMSCTWILSLRSILCTNSGSYLVLGFLKYEQNLKTNLEFEVALSLLIGLMTEQNAAQRESELTEIT